MIWSKPRFQHSFELLPRVLKEVAPLLFPIALLIWGLEFYVAYLNKARFDDPYNASMMLMIGVGLTGVILQSFASVIGTLYVARSTQRQMKNGAGEHPWKFLTKHFHQTFIEYLRSFISVGLYTLCLILPGIYRSVQLLFTCFVSAFDPDYQQGKVDALEESARLVRGAWIPLAFLILLQLFMPFVFGELAFGNYSFGDRTEVNQSLSVLSLVFFAIGWVVQLYLGIYITLTFFARHSYKMVKAS